MIYGGVFLASLLNFTKIVSVTIPSHSFLSTFTKKRDTIISWENIVKIGDDIILVKQEELQCFVY